MKHSVFDPDYQNNSVDGRIAVALERISEAFRVLLWDEGKKHSLSPIQVQVLIFLLHHSSDKGKVSLLAQEFNMTKATISDTIRSLQEKKLINKVKETHDSRSFTIHLTAKGKEIALKTSLFTQELETPIGQMHADDKESLLLSLIGIIHHLNKAGIITIQRMCFTCVHYESNYEGHQHYCQLLHQKLETTELRVDCREHELMN